VRFRGARHIAGSPAATSESSGVEVTVEESLTEG
jgi:hypothetical protein